MFQPYVQYKYKPNDKLVFNFGIHALYSTLNKQSSIEPRAGAKYFINNGQSISFGYGLHSQIQPIYIYFYHPDSLSAQHTYNKNIGFSKSHHWVLSYDKVLSQSF